MYPARDAALYSSLLCNTPLAINPAADAAEMVPAGWEARSLAGRFVEGGEVAYEYSVHRSCRGLVWRIDWFRKDDVH